MSLFINYLDIYTKKANQLTKELKHLQEICNTTADREQALRLIEALEELKSTINSLPLV
jgi:predicted RecB family endonuclease